METFRNPFRSMRYIHKVCAWSQYENPIWVYINGNVSNPLVIPATLYLMISNGTQNRSLKVISNSRPRFQTRVLRQYLDTISRPYMICISDFSIPTVDSYPIWVKPKGIIKNYPLDIREKQISIQGAYPKTTCCNLSVASSFIKTERAKVRPV